MNLFNQDLINLFKKNRTLIYKKDSYIIRAEDVPQGIYYLNRGYVRMFTIFEDGKELTLNIFKPNSYFPMLWAIGDIPNNYYFQTITETEVFRIRKEEILNYLNNNPEELMRLTKRMLRGLNNLIVNMQELLNGDADKKISSTLLYLASNLGERKGNSVSIMIPLTHQDIANLSGVSRETTSLILKKMENNKLIFFNKHFIEIKSKNEILHDPEYRNGNITDINII